MGQLWKSWNPGFVVVVVVVVVATTICVFSDFPNSFYGTCIVCCVWPLKFLLGSLGGQGAIGCRFLKYLK